MPKVEPLNQKGDTNSHFVGKVSGSSSMNMDFGFAKLMAAHKQKVGNKSHNFKEAKKANIRRNEKYER